MKEFVTIYFSRDRAMQLDLAIRSNFLYRDEQCDEFVLYKASNEHRRTYDILEKEYPRINFIEEKNFKDDLLNIVTNYENVIFVVDDTVFVGNYSLSHIRKAFKVPQVVGFSLRLGNNTRLCYPYNNRENSVPFFADTAYSADFFVYNWTRIPFGDFGYPLEVSSSAYRIGDIFSTMEHPIYKNPNMLEWEMDNHKHLYKFEKKRPLLACYLNSVAFSNPLNKVQRVNFNRSGNRKDYSSENLRYSFERDYRIQLSPFKDFIPTGCHQEVELVFEKKT